MDQNHPIPQQISSYQFRLVGDMTLKQFFQLAGGVLVGLLFYSLPLHALIKWPLVAFCVLMGVALAFFPLEERPLEKWIIAFFRSIYSPTLFSWGRNPKILKYYQEEAMGTPNHQIIAPQGQEALNAYLATPSTNSSFFSKLENSEKSFLSKVGSLFGPGSPSSGSVSVAPQIPTSQVSSSAPLSQTTGGFTAAPISTDAAVPPTIAEVPKLVSVPANQPVSVPAQTSVPKFVVQETPGVAQDVSVTNVDQAPSAVPLPGGQQAIFSTDAAPPNPPQIPNTISGQVLSPDGKIIEGAILEIRDISGRPVRASKSNKLGHFYVVTALLNGNYEIITEKDGFEFSPTTFEAGGVIIPPIAIRSIRKLESIPTANTNLNATQALQI